MLIAYNKIKIIFKPIYTANKDSEIITNEQAITVSEYKL